MVSANSDEAPNSTVDEIDEQKNTPVRKEQQQDLAPSFLSLSARLRAIWERPHDDVLKTFGHATHDLETRSGAAVSKQMGRVKKVKPPSLAVLSAIKRNKPDEGEEIWRKWKKMRKDDNSERGEAYINFLKKRLRRLPDKYGQLKSETLEEIGKRYDDMASSHIALWEAVKKELTEEIDKSAQVYIRATTLLAKLRARNDELEMEINECTVDKETKRHRSQLQVVRAQEQDTRGLTESNSSLQTLVDEIGQAVDKFIHRQQVPPQHPLHAEAGLSPPPSSGE